MQFSNYIFYYYFILNFFIALKIFQKDGNFIGEHLTMTL